ncbi:hypothetical protein K3152_07335 [Qipengyuania sp. 1NDH17]|uniref:Uncharacterized protein n=1 Tax=Qipengyuania polymorpha TaxID=2867234 RepID=A0ABS7IWX9_9SPHN|nr:hypothetical protein [Qipengyuania polymorpha]MBX7458057.1 hypothetical protein [Qipengyuania polymorpha]
MSTRDVTRRGRPLAFLAALGFSWIGLRLAVLTAWPEVESGAPAQNDPAVQMALRAAEQDQPTVAGSETVEPQAPQPAPATQEPAALEAPPPAHLENGFDPLPAAAAHNALWMDASGDFEAAVPLPVAAPSEPPVTEEF